MGAPDDSTEAEEVPRKRALDAIEEEEEEEEMVGPTLPQPKKRRKQLEFEKVYLDGLPSAEM
jgi:hypothetical protein